MTALKKPQSIRDSGIEWLGSIPEHWRALPIGALLEERGENNQGPKTNTVLSVLRDVGVILYEDKGDIGNKKSDDIGRYKIVRKGDLVVNSMNVIIGSVGISPYYGALSPVYLVLKPRHGSSIIRKYLGYVFQIKTFQRWLKRLGYGILEHRLRIPLDNLKREYLPIPPTTEQRTIAAFLDHETARIDRLIAKQERLIELLKEKRQAVISHAVTKGLNPDAPVKDSGVEWLGEVPAHWKTMALRHALSDSPRNGISPPVTNAGRVPTFSISAVNGGRVDVSAHLKYAQIDPEKVTTFHVRENDILILRGNGNLGLVGKAGIVADPPPKDCIYPDILIRLRPRRFVMPHYLVLALNSDYVRPQVELAARTSAGIWKISGDRVSRVKMAIPPRQEQAKILAYVDSRCAVIDELIGRCAEARDLLFERRSTIISSAVTGKIDVSDWKPPFSGYVAAGATRMNENSQNSAEEWNSIVSKVTDKMKSFVRPFISPLSYETTEYVRLAGSGTFVAIDDRELSVSILTCEHVVAERNLHYRFYGAEDIYGWDSAAPWRKESHPIDAAYASIPNYDDAEHNANVVSMSRFSSRHQPAESELLFFMGFAGENQKYGFDVHCCPASGYCSQEKRCSGDDEDFELFWCPEKTQFAASASDNVKKHHKHEDARGFSGSLVWNTRYVETSNRGDSWDPDKHATVTGLLRRWDPNSGTLLVWRVEHLLKWLGDQREETV